MKKTKLKKSKKDMRKTVSDANDALEAALDYNQRLEHQIATLEAELESCEKERDGYEGRSLRMAHFAHRWVAGPGA